MIRAQGDPDADLPVALETDVITAEQDGVLQFLDARAVGEAAWRLGAGRARKEQSVQPELVSRCTKPGIRVRAGQPLITLHTDTPSGSPGARGPADAAGICDAVPEERPLILSRVHRPQTPRGTGGRSLGCGTTVRSA